MVNTNITVTYMVVKYYYLFNLLCDDKLIKIIENILNSPRADVCVGIIAKNRYKI